MRDTHHKIPSLLSSLIECGMWANGCNEVRPLLGKKAANQLSQEDDRVVLMRPPFHTIADEVRQGSDFWTKHVSNPTEIDYEQALVIADFGAGSDSPIILYYRTPDSPVVMYLRWTGDGPNVRHRWVQTHSSFEEFAAAVGLDTRHALSRDGE